MPVWLSEVTGEPTTVAPMPYPDVPAAQSCTLALVSAVEPAFTVPVMAVAMVKVMLADSPAFVFTVTFTVPTVVSRSAVTVALISVELSTVVASALPFQLTTALESKLVPVTRRVKVALPGEAVTCDSEEMVGAPNALMVKCCAAEVPPSSVTVTLAVPELATRSAVTAAVNFVELPKVVPSAVPFQFTTAPETKPVPSTSRVKAPLPAFTEDGLRPVMETAGAVTVKVEFGDVPADSLTVTLAVPAVAMRFVGTVAVNCVALPKVVASGVPFQFTVAPEAKFVPFTVRVKPRPPAGVVAGERLVMVGPTELTVKGTTPEMPDDCETAIFAVVALAIRLVGTVAVSCVGLTTVVGVNAWPFHSTVAPETKLLPLTVSVNAALPALILVGLTLLTVGAGNRG